MRNLLQYPITLDEKIKVLEELRETCLYEDTSLIGDIRPVALREIIEDLKKMQSDG